MTESASGDIEPSTESETAVEIDFRDRDLRGRDFSGDVLRNANFSGADLRGCRFVDTDLSAADFQGAKIGVDGDRASRLLTAGFISSLGYVFLFALFAALIEWIELVFGTEANLNDIPDVGSRNASSEEESTTDGNYTDSWLAIGGSDITPCMLVLIICILLSIVITILLIFGYVNADSINEAHIMIPGFLALASICLAVAITKAQDLAQTDFSQATLDLAQIDRSSFQ
jgi:uncharacterized protein YjbI with pentapeptide repeats